jgi:hypothetical protein
LKYLLYADAILLAAGTAMSVTLAVVCLLFAIYRGTSPEITRGLPTLVFLTVAFFALTLFSGAAWQSLRRNTRWKWLAQAALAVAAPAIGILIMKRLSSQ